MVQDMGSRCNAVISMGFKMVQDVFDLYIYLSKKSSQKVDDFAPFI
ncbi:hypothetical protein [Clostridioides sp. ZZV14-6150]|nr:hypothetical protein [Clostridioides sp. ZZV14-6150]MCC0722662.1 hypothetical protein [Clostridioides sp. ZZV14-6104]